MAQLLRLPRVMERTGLRETLIYALMAEGSFPLPIRLGSRAVAWLESEVDIWIETQALKPRAEIRTKTPKKSAVAA